MKKPRFFHSRGLTLQLTAIMAVTLAVFMLMSGAFYNALMR